MVASKNYMKEVKFLGRAEETGEAVLVDAKGKYHVVQKTGNGIAGDEGWLVYVSHMNGGERKFETKAEKQEYENQMKR